MFKYILGVMIFSLGLMACSNDNDNDTATQVITPPEQVITPAASALTMSFTPPTKVFRFNWPAATNAPYYNLS